jgi:hypothetical protein
MMLQALWPALVVISKRSGLSQVGVWALSAFPMTLLLSGVLPWLRCHLVLAGHACAGNHVTV